MPRWAGSLWRTVLRLGLIALIVWAGSAAHGWLIANTAGDTAGHAALALMLLAYVVVLAIPFMPGVEIGITLLAMRGAEAAPYVWAATVLGLTLAWATGRWLPGGWVLSGLRGVGLTSFADTLERLGAQPLNLRLRFICQKSPNWLGPIIRDWRYVALAILLNIPGNAVIGGGGGIALMAGLSRLFTWPAVLLTFVIATAPLPILVYFAGPDILPWTR